MKTEEAPKTLFVHFNSSNVQLGLMFYAQATNFFHTLNHSNPPRPLVALCSISVGTRDSLAYSLKVVGLTFM